MHGVWHLAGQTRLLTPRSRRHKPSIKRRSLFSTCGATGFGARTCPVQTLPCELANHPSRNGWNRSTRRNSASLPIGRVKMSTVHRPVGWQGQCRVARYQAGGMRPEAEPQHTAQTMKPMPFRSCCIWQNPLHLHESRPFPAWKENLVCLALIGVFSATYCPQRRVTATANRATIVV